MIPSANYGKHGPASIDVIPRYSLEYFPYADRPEYIALSYVWGEKSLASTIAVNGEDKSITTNLAQALSSTRESDPGAYIWADSVCINQQDDEEKSLVVQHMGEIFANARLVYAWLGPIEDINLDALQSRFAQPPGRYGGFPVEQFEALGARPFWSRIWVLQEIFLAKSLYYVCGNRRLSGRILAGAFVLLVTFHRHVSQLGDKVELDGPLERFVSVFFSFAELNRLINYTLTYPGELISLWTAMTFFCVKELPRGSKTTDPRDMIYGLLGFAKDEEKSYIRADYGKSVPETYSTVTRLLIQNGFTDVLAWAQPGVQKITDLPSWVPDYSSTIYHSLCSQGQVMAVLPQFRACGQTKYSDVNSRPFDPHVLPVHGWRLDDVLLVGKRWFPRSRGVASPSSRDDSETPLSRRSSDGQLQLFLDEVRYLVRQADSIHRRNTAVSQGCGEKPPRATADSIWRVPCCDQVETVSMGLVRGDASARSYYEATLRGLEARIQEPAHKYPVESQPFLRALFRWAHRRPFLTAGGFVGLGPAEVEPGDFVAVLDGFNACYVLRDRDPRGGGEHRLVGEAYVDGVMDGEMADPVPDTREWFYLV
ncbi:HET-domain-containing protein [Nemania serpens]|nr:HET-domain-containing protein [Nemania serpens]